jgi:hypothetical protein
MLHKFPQIALTQNVMATAPAVVITKKLAKDTAMFQTNRFFLFAFVIILLISACVPIQPAAQPGVTSAPQAASSSLPPPALSATSTPKITPTSPLPDSPFTFDVLIDNLAISPQGELYIGGFGKGSDFRHFARREDSQWIELGSGFPIAGNTMAVDQAGTLYTDVLVDFEQGQATAIIRWDGQGWEDITGNFSLVVDAIEAGRVSSNIPVAALAVDGEDLLYAAGMFYYPTADHTSEVPMGYVARWDGQTWTVLGQGLDRVNIFGLAVSPAGQVYVSGEQPSTPEGNSSYLAQWDGETWTPITTSAQSTIQGITFDKTGRLYAYSQSNVIASWDGTAWKTITDSLSGEAPAVYDMASDGEGRLCIGGSFEAVSGLPARNIACWDGSSWQALGDGTNERVNALAFDPGGDIYAVGFFTEAGGAPADHAARWDGKVWHPLEP